MPVSSILAKFVPWLMTKDQNQHRIEDLSVSNDDTFLKSVLRGGEIWIYGYDIETKVVHHSRNEEVLRNSREHVRQH